MRRKIPCYPIRDISATIQAQRGFGGIDEVLLSEIISDFPVNSLLTGKSKAKTGLPRLHRPPRSLYFYTGLECSGFTPARCGLCGLTLPFLWTETGRFCGLWAEV